MTARLIVEAGIATPPVCELTNGAEVLVGRHCDSGLFLQDRHASRLHARIYQENGTWHLADQGTTNGTRVDGRRVETTALKDDQVISIGDVRLRFRLRRSSGDGVDEPARVAASQFSSSEQTHFEPDDLTALLSFAQVSLTETSPEGLIGQALDAVSGQTGATLVGFLSLDADPPEVRQIRPREGAIDARLSQHLTKTVLLHGKMVWLGANGPAQAESESLSNFSDAVCVPLRGAGAAWGQDGDLPLGALHVYRTARSFTERQVKFCEVVAATLATALAALRDRRAREADIDRLRAHAAAATNDLVGSSPLITKVREAVRRLANSRGTVLVRGETGVGKDLVALGLHRQSPRHAGPLVIVNCTAMDGSAAEVELFGTARQGAVPERAGYYAQADMGTLYLDEICGLSLDLQSKLVRAIETRQFRPVNARGDSRADVRVVAATRLDIEQELKEGRLRHELFYLLTTRILVPPLRERPEDIPELAQHFLECLGREFRRSLKLSESARVRLTSYKWPGNVRQFRSVLEAAVANSGDSGKINANDLPMLDPLEEPLTDLPPSLNHEQLQKWAIRQAMRRTQGNVKAAAKLLGRSRDTVHGRLKKYQLEGEVSPSSEE